MDLDEYLESLLKTKKVIKFPMSMYYSEGSKYLNLLKYDKALQFLSEAVEHDPTNIKFLLKRSKCYIGLREYKKAIIDAEKVLQLSPNNVHAIDIKGEAQYLMGDFEGGFLTYLEGRKINPANQVLRLGTQLCQDALDNSLHPRLEVKYQKADVVSMLKTEKDDEKFQKKLKHRKSARECFGKDAKFMEDLMADKNLKSVHGFCKEAIDYIRHRERFWSMETPLHSRRKHKEIKEKEIKRRKVFEENIRICNAAKRRAQTFLHKGKYDDCISEATNLLNSAESLLKDRENEKMKFRCDAYHLLGLSYKQIRNFSRAFQYLFEELKVAKKFDLTFQEATAYHQLGVICHMTGDTTGTMRCLDKIIQIMNSEKVDKLLPKNASAEEIQQLKEAEDWVGKMIPEIRKLQECYETKQKAESALENEMTDECITVATDLLKLIDTFSKELENEKIKLKCDAYHLLGLAYKQQKNIDRAFDYFSKELKISTKFNFTLDEIKAYHQLGVIYHTTGDTTETVRCLNKIVEIMNSEKVDEFSPESATVEENKPIQEVNEWVKSMISEIKKFQEFENIRLCNVTKQKAESAMNDGNADNCIHEATNLLNMTELLSKEHENEKMKLKCEAYHLMSLAYKQKTSFSNAFQYVLKELEIAEEFNFILQEVKAYRQLGVIYHVTGNTTETVHCLNKIIEIMNSERAGELSSKSVADEEVSAIKEINEWVRNTISEVKRDQELENIRACKVAKQIAESALERGEPDNCISEAKNLLHLTESLSKEHENEKMILKCAAYYMLGLAYKQKKNFPDALQYFLKNLEIAEKFNFILEKAKAYHQLGVIYQLTFDTENAMHCVNKIEDLLNLERDKEETPEEIKQLKEIEKWIKNMSVQIERTPQEPMKINIERDKKGLEDELNIKGILNELTEEIAIKEAMQVLDRRKSKIEQRIPVSDSKFELYEPEKDKEMYKPSSERVSEYLDVESSIHENIRKLTEHVTEEELVQLVPFIEKKEKESYKSSKERKSKDSDEESIVESIVEKIAERVSLKDPIKSDQLIEKEIRAEIFIPDTITKYESSKMVASEETYKIIDDVQPGRERELKLSEDKCSIEDMLKKLTECIAKEDSEQVSLPVKEKAKREESIPTSAIDSKQAIYKPKEVKGIREPRRRESEDSVTSEIIKKTESGIEQSVFEGILKELTEKIGMEDSDEESIVESIVEKMAERVSLKDPIKSDEFIQKEVRTEIFIPDTITKYESSKLAGSEEAYKTIDDVQPGRERELKLSEDKCSIEDILKKLTEHIAEEDSEQVSLPVKEKAKREESIPTSAIASKQAIYKPKEVKGIREPRRRESEDSVTSEIIKKTESGIEQSVFEGILKELTGKIAMEDSDEESIVENIVEKMAERVSLKDPIKSDQFIQKEVRTEIFIPDTITKYESSKLAGSEEAYETIDDVQPGRERELKLSEDKCSIEDILKKLTEHIAEEDSEQVSLPVKEKAKREESIPTSAIDSKQAIYKPKEVKGIREPRRRESEDSVTSEIIKKTESGIEQSVFEGILKELTEKIAMEDSDEESIVESIVEKMAERVSLKDPIKSDQFIQKEVRTEIFIPDTITKYESSKMAGSEEAYKTIDDVQPGRERELKLSEDKCSIEDILKKLTERIAKEDSEQVSLPVKEKAKREESIPTSVVDSKQAIYKPKEVKGIREPRRRESEDSVTSEIIKKTEIVDDQSVFEGILKELTEKIGMEDSKLIESFKLKHDIKDTVPTTITESKIELYKPEEVKIIDKSEIEKASDILLKDKSSVKHILDKLTDIVTMEDSIQVEHTIRQKDKKDLMPATTIDSKDGMIKHEKEEGLQHSDDEDSATENIFKKQTESVSTDKPVHLIQPPKEKSEEYIPSTVVDKTSEIEKTREDSKLSKEYISKDLDDKSIAEEILEELIEDSDDDMLLKDTSEITDVKKHQMTPLFKSEGGGKEFISAKSLDGKDKIIEKVKEIDKLQTEKEFKDPSGESITKSILRKPTKSDSIEDSVQIAQPFKGKEKSKEFIPSIVSDESSKIEKTCNIWNLHKETLSDDSDDKSIAEEIPEELIEDSDDESLPKDTTEVTDIKKQQMTPISKSKDRSKELIPATPLDSKDKMIKVEKVKEIDKLQGEKEMKVPSGESLARSVWRRPTKSIPKEDSAQIIQPPREKEKSEEFISNMIIDDRSLKETKGAKDVSTEKIREISDEKLTPEEISDLPTVKSNEEPLIKNILEKLTDSIVEDEQTFPFIKKSKESEYLTSSGIIDKDILDKPKVKSIAESESHDSSEESVIEEMLEEITESTAMEDKKQHIQFKLDEEFEKKLDKLEEVKKSPSFSKQIEKVTDSKTSGLVGSEKEWDKLVNVRQISKLISRRAKMFDLDDTVDFVVYKDEPTDKEKKSKQLEAYSSDEEIPEEFTDSDGTNDSKEEKEK